MENKKKREKEWLCSSVSRFFKGYTFVAAVGVLVFYADSDERKGRLSGRLPEFSKAFKFQTIGMAI